MNILASTSIKILSFVGMMHAQFISVKFTSCSLSHRPSTLLYIDFELCGALSISMITDMYGDGAEHPAITLVIGGTVLMTYVMHLRWLQCCKFIERCFAT